MKDALYYFVRLWSVFRKKFQQRDDAEEPNSHCRQPYSALPEDICRQFSLAEIKAATNNFSPDLIIGIGAFGTVYRGTVGDGPMIVAVKRFRSSSPSAARHFQTEVQFLCQLRHPLLVSLVGFCEERNEMIVVYEYMSKGTISDHLNGKAFAPLPWKKRLQICISAARGLHYLHTGAKYALIHGNIHSSKILLNEDFSCKLHGFGFSKLGSFSMSKALKVRKESIVMGTSGYIAPEYVNHGELTEKSDVFQFGFVLYQVLFGRAAVYRTLVELRRQRTIYDVIDPYLKGRIAPECLKKYLEIACSCIQYNGNERPTIGEVEVTLELALKVQEKADSEMEGINPYGERMYEEASFSVFISQFYDPFSDWYGSIHYSTEPESNNSHNNG